MKQSDPRRNVWIVKPSNSSRGRGIHIIDDINDLNVDELSIISRYVTNPLLINGYKFDLRIYVVVTCYEPLRLYVYKEGLARFASETYTAKFNKNNRSSVQSQSQSLPVVPSTATVARAKGDPQQ